MIMSLIVITFFRGSPIQPAGTSLTKPLHVRSAEGRVKVHSKFASEERKCNSSQTQFILKHFKILSMTFLGLFPSSGGANPAAVTVTRQIPRAQSCPDPDPSLQVWVGGGLSRLYDAGLRGTPLMLSVCLNVNLSFPLVVCLMCGLAHIALGDLDVLDHLYLRVGDDLLTWVTALLANALLIGWSGLAAGTGTRAAHIALACAAIVILVTGWRAAAVTEIHINSDTHYAAAPFSLVLTLLTLHDLICDAMMIFVDGVTMTDHQTFLCLDLYQVCWFYL